MVNNDFALNRKHVWPWLAIAIVLTVAIYQLRYQGRLWICSCGQIYLWTGDVWSSDNSQHWFDPYSFSHLLHGVIFLWALAWSIPRLLSPLWSLWLALSVEASWEVFENSAFIINRYREATAALGYEGDTIVNSLGDIFSCAIGFVLAYYLGFRRSLAVFVIVEVTMLFWIRDSLILNIIMLIYPIEVIRVWQLGP